MHSPPGSRMSDPSRQLARGDVVWIAPDPVVGGEQKGRRPAVIVASNEYLTRVPRLAIILPVTSSNRGWPNHVSLPSPEAGLSEQSFAMTEQVRTIDRQRIERRVGHVGQAAMAQIAQWLADHLGIGR